MEETHRFKGLHLIVTVPEELWMEVPNIVQDSAIKAVLKKKKCQQAQWLSEETLQIAEKRKRNERQRRKGKIHPSECRVPRRDMKAFLNDQRNRENNRMGETRDLFEKIGDTKGIFHAKMGTIKYRNSMYLTNTR